MVYILLLQINNYHTVFTTKQLHKHYYVISIYSDEPMTKLQCAMNPNFSYSFHTTVEFYWLFGSFLGCRKSNAGASVDDFIQNFLYIFLMHSNSQEGFAAL